MVEPSSGVKSGGKIWSSHLFLFRFDRGLGLPSTCSDRVVGYALYVRKGPGATTDFLIDYLARYLVHMAFPVADIRIR